jgi:hypothetical protein
MSQQISEALNQLDLMISNAAGPAGTAAGGTAVAAAGASNGSAVATAPPAAPPAGPPSQQRGSIRQRLSAAFQASIDEAFPGMTGEEAKVAPCANPKFGDYQCNNAMGLFGKLKGQVRPSCGGLAGGSY